MGFASPLEALIAPESARTKKKAPKCEHDKHQQIKSSAEYGGRLYRFCIMRPRRKLQKLERARARARERRKPARKMVQNVGTNQLAD